METLRILANCHWPVFLRGKFTKISRGTFSLLFKRLLEGCYLLLYVTCPQIIPCKVWHTENSNNLGMLSLEFKVFYSCSHPDSYYGIGVSLRKLSRAVRCYLGLFISMWVVWLTSSASTDSPLCIIYIHSCINHSRYTARRNESIWLYITSRTWSVCGTNESQESYWQFDVLWSFCSSEKLLLTVTSSM